MNSDRKLKKWELALVLSLCVTLCHGLVFSAPGVAWWGVIFPELTAGAYKENVETVKLDGQRGAGGVQIKFQLLEWLDGLF